MNTDPHTLHARRTFLRQSTTGLGALALACLLNETTGSARGAAMPGVLKGVGRVVRWGKTLAFTEGELYDAEGRLVAKATGTAVPTPFKTYK